MPYPMFAALDFLIQISFSIFLLALLLRFLSQSVHANVYNPAYQLIMKFTNPIIVPLRRLIPGVGGVDWACVVAMFILDFLQFLILYVAIYRFPWHVSGLLLLVLLDLIELVFQFYFFSIIILAVVSWFIPIRHNPVLELLNELTMPLFRLFHRIFPHGLVVSGFDFMPLLMLICLKLVEIALLSPLIQFAQDWMMGRAVLF